MSESTETERADASTETESGTRPPEARQAPGEAPERAARPKGIGPLGWLRWAWRQLTTMRTALVLLFLVALGSVPGSVFPQRGQAPEEVAAYLEEHQTLGPWLDRFSMFDVFAAPWFAAIYILLFVSLAGCVIPRAGKHYRSMRARPPAAPRNLKRLPQAASFETDAPADDVLEDARRALRRKRFRVDVSGGAVSAEKGYLGETGNLVFHLALLALLFALGIGNTFGYRGNILLTEGETFANSLSLYDQFEPGTVFSADELPPFTLRLEDFEAEYHTEGESRGAATDYTAKLHYRESPQGAEKPYDLKVNHPLEVGGAQVYLLNNGYSPVFTVRDANGNVAFKDAVPFLPMQNRNKTSEGVIKAPDAQPEQLAFYAILWPTAAPSSDGKQIVSAFPAALNPVVTITSFKGDIGLDDGTPQSVYRLEGIGTTLDPVDDGQKLLKPGETFELPGGAGSITFEGVKEWAALSVNRDPGRMPALIAAILAVAGIVASFMVRRRRMWVRASAGKGGRTVVEVGGLTLGSPTSEFDDIVAALRGPDRDAPDPDVLDRDAPDRDKLDRDAPDRDDTDRDNPDRDDPDRDGPADEPGAETESKE